jgi:hypothetical protein
MNLALEKREWVTTGGKGRGEIGGTFFSTWSGTFHLFSSLSTGSSNVY